MTSLFLYKFYDKIVVMKDLIIVSDFDGTITEKDSLYHFFEKYALPEWTIIEQKWVKGEITSKNCLTEEFKLVPNLTEELINNFIRTIKLDKTFKQFNESRIKKGYDFVIVSDGLDFFINKILYQNELKNINVISNHAEFIDGHFVITFPNDSSLCKKDAGTCKCKVLSDLRKTYNKICYIGDGVSDFCVADKADILYAKKSLAKYCNDNKLEYNQFDFYSDINV